MPTPLKLDGSIDRERLEFLVDFLIEGGIDGLFPLGTSGEFALLTREERRMVLSVVAEKANGRVPVFGGISDPSTENEIAFAADAEQAGVDGVVATPPYYYTTTEEALYGHYRRLAEAVSLPLMVYNIPEWAHSFVPPEVVGRLASEGLIVGMKYTEPNLLNLLRFIEETGKSADLAIFTGSDAMAYAALEFGGAGAIIGVSNVAPDIAAKIFDDYRSGDRKSAREAQVKLLPLIRAIGTGKFPSGLKETMKLMGNSVGPAREPLPPPSMEEVKVIKALLNEFSHSRTITSRN